jgi:hypothetical protein
MISVPDANKPPRISWRTQGASLTIKIRRTGGNLPWNPGAPHDWIGE